MRQVTVCYTNFTRRAGVESSVPLVDSTPCVRQLEIKDGVSVDDAMRAAGVDFLDVNKWRFDQAFEGHPKEVGQFS